MNGIKICGVTQATHYFSFKNSNVKNRSISLFPTITYESQACAALAMVLMIL